ncbi:MAG: DEAD/DEAH box helicase [Acidimicrobiales bacterium]|nr:DEAD/DEAH box helicase [Acidimicrobiales bacterium]
MPDQFQIEGFGIVDEGLSLLVAAPTSAGKTLIAEYAIEKALAKGQTVVYTTPIKALSNQKFKDLSRWLGKERVGLLTGDNAIRSEAEVVVMTTEVLRNMIYAASPRLDNLGLVVLDEVHFLQDPYRGPVWEEVIMQLPARTRLVCLSATVSNAAEVAGWITEVHGECIAVIETTRPVELHDHFLIFDKRHRRLQEFRTLRNGETNYEVERYLAKMRDQRHRGPKSRAGDVGRPRRGEVIAQLDQLDRLPAIFFVFSRQGCDDAVQNALEHGLDFLDGREKQRVETIVEQHLGDLAQGDLSLLNFEGWLRGLQAGLASHHAGMVTPFKEAVEDCFAAGLLKVVFATETLAMGVNLPAKSVVIEQLSRFRGEGHVMLTPGEYTQLTGRAGRRGIDTTGHAYALWSPYESFSQLTELARSNDFILESAFRPTYNMAANLMTRVIREDAVGLLERSFAQYRSNSNIVKLITELDKAKASLGTAESELKRLGLPVNKGQQADPRPNRDGSVPLEKLRPGAIIERIHGTETQFLLVLGTTSRRGGEHRIRVVSPRGKVMMLSGKDFDLNPRTLSDIELPKPYAPNRREYQRTSARLLKQQLTELGILLEVRRPKQDLQVERLKAEERVIDAHRRISALEDRIAVAEGGLSRALIAIEEIMETFGCCEAWQLTPLGQYLRGIFHEMDLLAALCISENLFRDLSPPDLASLVSVLTYEHRSRLDPPAPWYPSGSIKKKVEVLLAHSSRLRREERERGLPESRAPDPTIIGTVHGWASGHELADVLDDATSAGDFVRHIRQVIDLLSQIGEVAPTNELRTCARQACGLLDRDLVAAAARVQEGDHEVNFGDAH